MRVSRSLSRRPPAPRRALAPHSFGAPVRRSSTRMRELATEPTVVPV